MKVIMKHRYGYCCPPHRWYHCFDHGVPILDSGVHSTTKSFLQLSHLLEFKAYIIKNKIFKFVFSFQNLFQDSEHAVAAAVSYGAM